MSPLFLMLPWLIDQLGIGVSEVHLAGLEKITFRAALAALGSFLLAVLLGPRWIGWLRRRFREPIRSDSAELNRLHADKQFTPTMGGLFVVAAVTGAVALVGRLDSLLPATGLWVLLGLGTIGAADDLLKLRRGRGMSARGKLAGQFIVAAVAAVLLRGHLAAEAGGLAMHVPLIGSLSLGSGAPADALFLTLTVLVIIGSSNAVNLSDGLDGLAGGCLIFAVAAMTAAVYASGHAELAAYLGIPPIAGAGELTILGGAMIGAVLGFLWFNCHPAQVFLGDTGSLPLGGLLGVLAVAVRQEILLLAVGGVFVAETLSVILQVLSFRLRGRRLFRCAPLHHHFQFAGVAEGKIVVRFWIAAALCAVAGLATLKVSVHEQAIGPPDPGAVAAPYETATSNVALDHEPASIDAASTYSATAALPNHPSPRRQ